MTSTDVFDLCAPEEELCFSRGDTMAWQRIHKDEDGVVIDITGFSFKLTIDENQDPIDDSTNIFVATAVVPVGTDGAMVFQFTVANWTAFTAVFPDLPATGFYDVEQTDASGGIRTIRKGPFVVKQDITKP